MYRFQIPGVNLHFGQGAIDVLGFETKKLGHKCLLVTGRNSMRKLGVQDNALDLLRHAGIETVLFNGVEPNPTVQTVDQGARLALDHRVQVIVGLGGGSVIDTAKGIAIIAADPSASSIWDFSPTNKKPRTITRALPIVAITTTSGTGSHLTPYYVVSNTETYEKPGSGHPSVFPKCSIVDLEIIAKMPPLLTAETGFDVLTHALEGLVSSNSSPVSDVLALKAIELVYKYLPVAHKKGNDTEARQNMALADCLAGEVLSSADTVLGHAMSHAVSGRYHEISHGASLAALTPSVLRFTIENADNIVWEKYCSALRCIGTNITESTMANALRIVSKVEGLIDQLGLKKNLKQIGVHYTDLEAMTSLCMQMMAEDIARGPVVPTEEEMLSLFKDSY